MLPSRRAAGAYREASPACWYTKRAREDWFPPNGSKLIAAAPPATSSTGAVSPAARAMASMMPVTMPGRAVGRTIFRIVFHCGMPSAYAPSRSGPGTSRSISSVERTMVGNISTVSASEAAKPENRGVPLLNHGLTISTQKASTNRPATMDGMPVITSTKNRTVRANLPRPYSTR